MVIALLMSLALVDLDDYPQACRDDGPGMSSTCMAALRDRTWTGFSVTPIEQEAASGAQIMRAGFVDGYDRDLLVVSFEARPNQPPMVVVQGSDDRRISHPLSARAWEAALEGAVVADRELAPTDLASPPGEDGERTICMHGWATHVEMANTAGMAYKVTPVRRRYEYACGNGGLAFRYAFSLASLAVEAIPACAELKPEQHRNDPSRLAACLALEGNTVAAASLMNEKGEPPSASYGDTPDEREWSRWLATDRTSRLDWAGEVFEESNVFRSGQPSPPRLSNILAERTATLREFRIYQAAFGARDAGNGWITGELAYRIDGEDGAQRWMVADYRQEWSRGGGFGWRMDNWVIGPFRLIQLPED